MKHSKIPYTLILVQNQAIFFVYSAKEQWQNKRINGEINLEKQNGSKSEFELETELEQAKADLQHSAQAHT